MRLTVSKILQTVGLIFLMSSCTTSRMFTTLDILRPAQVTFPPEINSILIVDNSVAQPSNVGHYNKKLFEEYTSVEQVFDSASIFCTASLRESLEEKGFFKNVHMAKNRTNLTEKPYKITPLTSEAVKSLCAVYQADAILSLDRILHIDKITENIYPDDLHFFSNLDIQMGTVWSINYPTDKPTTYLQFADSFTWESSNTIRSKAGDKLPSRYNALVDASLLTGTNIADRMIPRWEKEDRYFYNPRNKYMRQAMDSVEVRNWHAAINLWKLAAEKSGYATKYRANYNIAIASEILGDMENAILYCDLAIEIYPKVLFAFNIDAENDIYKLMSYKEELQKRAKEINLIKKQLGN